MLTYSFAERGELSLYEYLYRCIRHDIERGAIAADEKLPSKRALARHLGVSVITVEGAYAQLVAEGYLVARERRGYYACDWGGRGAPRVGPAVEARPSVASEPAVEARHDATGGVRLPAEPDGRFAGATASCAQGLEDDAPREGDVCPEVPEARPAIADLTGAGIPSGLFPFGSWAKSLREALACEAEHDLIGPTEPFGLRRLRCAIADQIRGFRGMEVDPDCLVIGAGSQVLDNLLVQLLGHDLRYGVEDPGYPRLASIYRANGVALATVPLDGAGVRMDVLRGEGVDVMHVMPSHQYPTGLVTSISRRYELLGWAAEQPGRYLIEDDYDCEFRLMGRPIPTLASIDAAGCVIYANTFAKSLGPAFRVGYMVLPRGLAARFKEELGFYSCTVSAIDQLALARFIEEGDYERHVSRMRTHYRAVRDALIAALRASDLGERMSVHQEDAGIHFVLGIRCAAGAEGLSWDAALCREARERGVLIQPLSAFSQDGGASRADEEERRFVVSYGGVAPERAGAVARVCAQAAAAADAHCTRR